MSTIDRRLDKLEEARAPVRTRPPARCVFANSKAHADQLAAEHEAEQAKNPGIGDRLVIYRWFVDPTDRQPDPA